jgi:hypothetical protein
MMLSNQNCIINVLEGVLDELCSADLTLVRAKLLRHRLRELLEALQGPGTTSPEASRPG